ncbi:hypothetical protein [Actibacterium ureilyticum]|uniref:hypothetical protein n=1 Tax=Actibacterium ureilyticum TaxID=1590614 RepID=UPI000BAACB9C|nr:hypothetical protein [Actibacterium ureilyticum]
MILNARKSDALGARIRALVEDGLIRKKVSARKASIDVVGHDGLVRDIRAGRIPSFDRLVALFEYLSIPVQFGPAARGMAEDGPASDLNRPEALRAGYLPVPWHRLSAQRGAGPVAFANAQLQQMGLSPDSLWFIIPDRSLLAQAGAGAQALIDEAAPRQATPAPWCFLDDGQVVMARLHWQPDGLLVVSGDAPGAEVRVLSPGGAAAITPLGRVVWLGLTL